MKRPRKGEHYRSLHDVEVVGLVGFSGAPISQSCGGTLPAGTTIRVISDPSRRATAITARPLDSSRFETEFVSADDRAEQHYAGYYLVLSFEQLAKSFKLVT